MPHLPCKRWRNLAECSEHGLEAPSLFISRYDDCLVGGPALLFEKCEADILRLVGRRLVRGDKNHCVYALTLAVVDNGAVALLECPFLQALAYRRHAEFSRI